MGYYAHRLILIAGSAAFLIAAATMPYAARAGDPAVNQAVNRMIQEVTKAESQSKPCGAGQVGCGSASQPASSDSGSSADAGNGGIKRRRPIPRRNFSDSVKNMPVPDCNKMNSDGLLMRGHWDGAKLKCVYDKRTIRFPAPHAKFN